MFLLSQKVGCSRCFLHLRERHKADVFGFNIRQFPKGKHHTGKNTKGELLGFKTIITPSQEKVKAHYDRLSDVIDSHKSAPQAALIKRLNLSLGVGLTSIRLS